MAAIVTHVSTKLVLRLGLGDDALGKSITMRVTISGISQTASAEALLEAAKVLGALLEYPVTAVELHTVSTIERCDEIGEESRENVARYGLRTNRSPVLRFFSSIMPKSNTRLQFSNFTGNALRQVLSWQSSIFTSSGAACRYRAPPLLTA